ncbi:MAG TPA: flagellar hook capping FlgD N-terminal domain-containing protein [Steroidobacteraceae bacterium]|nr:flagellar hook capping FlgD N-terminal domain-containing protein [Steroidobacteraceae bacterium]
MAVSGIGIVSAGTTSSAPATPTLTQQDFLNILITQLQFQDPLQPMNDEQFVAQLAQFSALEINSEESSKLDTLLSFTSANQGINLIGKSVEVSTSQSGATGASSSVGTVSAVSFSTGQPLLTVTTSGNTLTDVPLTSVTLIQ